MCPVVARQEEPEQAAIVEILRNARAGDVVSNEGSVRYCWVMREFAYLLTAFIKSRNFSRTLSPWESIFILIST